MPMMENTVAKQGPLRKRFLFGQTNASHFSFLFSIIKSAQP